MVDENLLSLYNALASRARRSARTRACRVETRLDTVFVSDRHAQAKSNVCSCHPSQTRFGADVWSQCLVRCNCDTGLRGDLVLRLFFCQRWISPWQGSGINVPKSNIRTAP